MAVRESMSTFNIEIECWNCGTKQALPETVISGSVYLHCSKCQARFANMKFMNRQGVLTIKA